MSLSHRLLLAKIGAVAVCLLAFSRLSSGGVEGSRNAFLRNAKRVKKVAGNKEIIAAVKSSFGIDHKRIAQWMRQAGINTIAVDNIEQGVALRKALTGTDYDKLEIMIIQPFKQ